MFGRPAAYAGRRLFACIVDATLVVKLPEDMARREVRDHGSPFIRRGREMKQWVRYRPRTARDLQRLASVLEVAARHAAYQLTQE
jgi:hypothetical protein